MSIGFASSRNVTNNPTKNVQIVNLPATNNTPDPWVRPADWLTLPTVNLGDSIFTGLYAVYDTTQNYVSISAGGAFTVDWGDGTVENFATGVFANHLYDYASISGSTLTTRGYKQVIITVTPQAGNNLTGIDISRVTVLNPTTKYAIKWLDIAVGSPNLVTCLLASTGSLPMLEQFSLYSFASGLSLVSLCSNLYELRKFNIYGDTSTKTSTQSMFNNCISLQEVPYFDTSSVTNTSSMFYNCSSLKEIPEYNFSNVTSMNSIFYSCNSLLSVPYMDTSKVTTMSSMFYGCYSLQTVPAFNTSNVTTMFQMFMLCRSLVEVPYMNTSKVTDMSSFINQASTIRTLPMLDTSKVTNMYLLCENAVSLEYMPAWDMSKVTTIQSAFNNCNSLVTNDIGKFSGAPLLTGSGVQALHTNNYSLVNPPDLSTWSTVNCNNFTSMFTGCYSLKRIPMFDTSKATTFSGMFSNCYALEDFPALDTSNVTNTATMFANCVSLVTIPTFDTSKSTNAVSMFSNCRALISAPVLNTSNVTNMASMFVNCSALQEVPLYDTSKVTSMSLTFQNCTALPTVPLFDTSNVTVINSIYSGCSTLTYAPNLNTSKCTNVNSMYFSSSVTIIPEHDFSNVNTATTNFISTGGSTLTRAKFTGLKLTINLTNASLGKAEIEEVFTNLGPNNTSQTITISSNPGADFASSSNLTAGQAIGSTTLTVGTSNVYTIGQCAYNSVCFAPAAVTMQDTGDTVTRTNHGLSNGTRVSFATIVSTTGIIINTIYYVVNATTNTFQLSLTPGGSALPLTTNGSGTLRFEVFIIDKPTSTTVTVSAPTTATTTATALTSRYLNTYIATLKNWTVSG